MKYNRTYISQEEFDLMSEDELDQYYGNSYNDIELSFSLLEIYLKQKGLDLSKLEDRQGIMVYAKTKFNEMYTPEYVANEILRLYEEKK
jgi:hypothetical protein